MQNQEKELSFNSKFSNLIDQFSFKNRQQNPNIIADPIETFLLLNDIENLSLTNLRILLISKFLANFTNTPKY